MSKGRLTLTGLFITILSVFSLSPLVSAQGNSNADNKVTICHATSSQSNPYVTHSPNKNGVVNGHNSHKNNEDIIPPFDYNDHGTTKHFAGQNWDAQGQATYNNDCQVPEGGRGGEVLAASTAAAQVVAPKGGVGAGAGGGSAQSTGALVGLVASLGSLCSGIVWLRRRFDA